MIGDSIRERIRSAIQDLITDGKQSFTGIQIINQLTKNIQRENKRTTKLTEEEYDQLLEDFNWLIKNGFIMHDIGKSFKGISAFRLTKEGRENVF